MRARPSRTPTTSGSAPGSSPTPDELWGESELVCKVKEPISEEFHRLRDGLVLFTYLHLAAARDCTQAILDSRTTAIAYETVRLPDGSLPLLAPMSEIAGRMATIAGAEHLQRPAGGRGVLLSGVPGVRPGRVVVIGAGVAGSNAAAIAVGMHAEVVAIDRDLARLAALDRIYQGRLTTLASSEHVIEDACLSRRPRHRRRPRRRGEDAPARERRPRRGDAAGLGPRRHLGRPGRLFRVDPPDDALRSDVPRPRLALLLRRQHARRGAAHLDPRPHQRDAPLRDGDRRYSAGARRCDEDRALALGLNAVGGRLVSAPVAEAHGLDHVELDEVLA